MVDGGGRVGKRLRLICIGDEICSTGHRFELDLAYPNHQQGLSVIIIAHNVLVLWSKSETTIWSWCTIHASVSHRKGFHSNKRQNAKWPSSPSPPLRCNPNGNLALRGDKSYDLKRPSSVYVSLSRLKKGKEGCEEQDLKSEDQDRSLTAFSRDDINRSSGPTEPHKPGHQGPAIPEIIKFLSSCFWHFMATHLFLLDITGPAVFGAGWWEIIFPFPAVSP